MKSLFANAGVTNESRMVTTLLSAWATTIFTEAVFSRLKVITPVE